MALPQTKAKPKICQGMALGVVCLRWSAVIKEETLDDRQRGQITTSTRTLTREDVTGVVDRKILTVEEELLVRMLYGVGLDADAPLEFQGQDHMETRIKLAMIEKALLDEAEQQETGEDLLSQLD